MQEQRLLGDGRPHRVDSVIESLLQEQRLLGDGRPHRLDSVIESLLQEIIESKTKLCIQ